LLHICHHPISGAYRDLLGDTSPMPACCGTASLS
jgi:hypothetical protein